MTFLAALRVQGIIAPCVIDGPINGPMFLAWVTQFLVPTLRPGDIVVGDRDGVVVVPRTDAVEVLSLVHALIERETTRVAEIRSGVLFRAEIDESLRKKGVID